MKLCILIINIYFLVVASLSNFNNDIKMIHDLIDSYEIPASIVARVCWSSAIKMDFVNKLSNKKPKVVKIFNTDADFKVFTPNKDDIFIVDMNCEDAIRFLEQAHQFNVFNKPYRWILLDSLTNNSISKFNNMDIPLDSEVIIVGRKNNDECKITSIYKIQRKNSWYTEYFGSWSNIHGLNKSNEMFSSTVMRRKNLNGFEVVISAIISDNGTKNELESLSYNNIFIDTATKSSFLIINPLFQFINATKRVIYTDKWGINTNGTWSGMIGDLDSGTAELGGCITFITAERLGVLEYLTSPTPVILAFVFRSPPLSYQNNLFLLPFKPMVWYCTIAFAVILTSILYLNAKWEMEKQNKHPMELDDATTLQPNLSDVSILVVSAISQQGCNKELRGFLGRLVIFILYLTFLFLYTSYSANIMALLQSTSNQINSLNDLLYSKMEIGADDVNYNRFYFTTATDPVRKAIYEKKMMNRGPNHNFMKLEEGVKKLQTEPFAFHMHTSIGYKIVEKYFHEHEKCGLQEIEYIQAGKPWLCCRKNTPFKEIYKIGLMRIQEHGMSNRENNFVYSKKPACNSGGSSFGSVDMIDFYPVLLMLIYGATASILILFVEILVHRRRIAILSSN